MKKQALYRELAKYYDLIYSWKDYQSESEKIIQIIKKNQKSTGNCLLEVGCGTGKHLNYFKKSFDCTGIDINAQIVNVARRECKGVKFKQANMINFKLNQQFDVITSLFSSIGYVKSYLNLKKTIQNFSKHLKEGGVVVIEPWLSKEHYKAGIPHLTVYQGKDIKIARANVSHIKGGVSVLRFHYLIAEKNKETKHIYDEHELGLFDVKKTLKIMEKAGFKAKFEKNGLMKDRGLFIGIKE